MATVAPPRAVLGRPTRGMIVAAVLVGWLVLWLILRGINTLPLGAAQLTDLHRSLNQLNDAIGASRDT
ncbi:MAG: glycine betaine/proline transport system permease protein, partial [Pseudonocardiales bacterium]|nr:glycine betaine/proline transport system permease protein [Pseudonocardiales bacterium]